MFRYVFLIYFLCGGSREPIIRIYNRKRIYVYIYRYVVYVYLIEYKAKFVNKIIRFVVHQTKQKKINPSLHSLRYAIRFCTLFVSGGRVSVVYFEGTPTDPFVCTYGFTF